MYWYWFDIRYDSGSDCNCDGGTTFLVLFIGICLKLDTMVSVVVVVVHLCWYYVLVLV